MLGFAQPPKPLFPGFHTRLCTGHPPRWSVPSLGGPRCAGLTRSSLGSSSSCGVTTATPSRTGLLGHLPKLLCLVFTSLARLVLFPPLTQRSSEEQFPHLWGVACFLWCSLHLSCLDSQISVQELVQHHESSCWLVSFQVCTHSSVSLEIRIMVYL